MKRIWKFELLLIFGALLLSSAISNNGLCDSSGIYLRMEATEPFLSSLWENHNGRSPVTLSPLSIGPRSSLDDVRQFAIAALRLEFLRRRIAAGPSGMSRDLFFEFFRNAPREVQTRGLQGLLVIPTDGVAADTLPPKQLEAVNTYLTYVFEREAMRAAHVLGRQLKILTPVQHAVYQMPNESQLRFAGSLANYATLVALLDDQHWLNPLLIDDNTLQNLHPAIRKVYEVARQARHSLITRSEIEGANVTKFAAELVHQFSPEVSNQLFSVLFEFSLPGDPLLSWPISVNGFSGLIQKSGNALEARTITLITLILFHDALVHSQFVERYENGKLRIRSRKMQLALLKRLFAFLEALTDAIADYELLTPGQTLAKLGNGERNGTPAPVVELYFMNHARPGVLQQMASDAAAAQLDCQRLTEFGFVGRAVRAIDEMRR